MSRRQFTFRPGTNNAEHLRAWQTLLAVPEGQRNSFLVQAILEKAAREELETSLRRVLREELQSVTLAPTEEKPKPKAEVPTQMTDFLTSFLNQ